MSGRRLLYLNTHRLSAYVWQHRELRQEAVFEASEDDLGRFGAYLRDHATSPFHLLCNVAEESHQVEVIPFLQGKDRQTLIERKISQIFFGASLTASLSLGYEKTRRKNERLLLSALTNPAHLQPWLNGLAAAEVPLAGLYTVSQLGGQLLKKLVALPERCLLVTMQDHSLRESFVVKGVPIFSRMAPLNDSSIAGTAASMAGEAGKLYQYLVGQRQIGRNDTLPVFVLAHPHAVDAAQSACIDTGGLNFHILDSHQAATRLGLRSLPDDSRCEQLFLHLLATDTPRQQYLAADLRHDHLLHRLKGWLLGFGFAALAASALFTVTQLLSAYNNRQEAQDLLQEESQLSQRYKEISATFPQLGVSNDVLRRVSNRYQDIQRVRRQPADVYRLVSRALDQLPAIELESIDWKLAATDNGKPAPLSEKSSLLGATDEVAVIHGTIRLAPNAQPRQVMAAFEQLVRQLQTDPALRVTVLQQPFETESGRSLKGGTLEDENPQPRTFSLQLSRKLPT